MRFLVFVFEKNFAIAQCCFFCSPWWSFNVFRSRIFCPKKRVFFVLRLDFLVQMVSTVSLGAKPPDPLGQCIDAPPRNPKKKFPVCDARERSERVLGRKNLKRYYMFHRNRVAKIDFLWLSFFVNLVILFAQNFAPSGLLAIFLPFFFLQ